MCVECSDQDRQDYLDLVEEVRQFNPAAAEAMEVISRNEAFNFHPDADLRLCFIWDQTLEGAEYWTNLEREIQSRRAGGSV